MINDILVIEAKLHQLEMDLARLLRMIEMAKVRKLKPSEKEILEQLEKKGH